MPSNPTLVPAGVLTSVALSCKEVVAALPNVVRNVWAYMIIFCGHFPDGVEQFTEEQIEGESRGDWYVRQLLGSANLEGGKTFNLMTGQLSFQIEHHLFPDLPSNRYAEMSTRVRALCQKYDLPYTTGSFTHQYTQTLRTLRKLSLPDRFLTATADAAPETASERGGTVQQLRRAG